MRAWALDHEGELFACDLLRTEALRVARRHSPRALAEARLKLEGITLLVVTTEICERAAELDPAILRALDALHLSAAMTLGDQLRAIVTYDGRLQSAAELHGIPTLSP